MRALDIKENYPLKDLTTFKIGGSARYFVGVHSIEELFNALCFMRRHKLNLFVLGGGSNVLISDRGFDGLVLKVNTTGVNIIKEDEQAVRVSVAAGVCWDEFVANAVEAGWWGIENLSYIPGNAGAFAIQNVGAYGQEASAVVDYVEVYNIATDDIRTINKKECVFSYRTSVFNSTLKGKYIILNTVLKLKKHSEPNINYYDVRKYFEHRSTPTLQQMREAISRIRSKKLPDPAQIGNAGSFFKNLIVKEEEFEDLKTHIKYSFGEHTVSKVEALRHKFACSEEIKIPTAFLLDICGLKDVKVGGAAFYEKHPLVIVNTTGSATAHDVMSLMKTARQTVYQYTGMEIFPEPNLIGFRREELEEYFLLE